MSNIAKTYFVRDFELVEISDFTLLISDKSTIKINDPSLLNFLSSLRANSRSYMKERTLGKMAAADHLPPSRLTEFLRNEAGLIVEATGFRGKSWFRNIKIYKDFHIDIEDWLDYLTRDGVTDVEISNTKDISTGSKSCHDGSLVAIFLKNYDPEPIRKLYSSLDDSGENAALTAYVFGDQFWIDGIYMNNMGMPSHFSHINKWRRMYKEASTLGWSDLVDLFADKDVPFLNPYRPIKMEINIAAIHFLRRIVDFSGSSGRAIHLNDMLQAQRVDLRTGACFGEIVSAWPSSSNSDILP